MTDLERAKDTIRKLLNLANDDAAAQGEIDTALRFARRLMLQHNISENDVSAPQDPHEVAADTEYGETLTHTRGARLSTWEVHLIDVIGRLVGTVGSYMKRGAETVMSEHGTIVYDDRGQPRRGIRVAFYGPAEDARDAAELFAEWGTVIVGMARMKFGGCFRGPGRSYAEGFVTGMEESLNAIQAEEKTLIDESAAETESALFLCRTLDVMAAKKQCAEDWLRYSRGIDLRKAPSRNRSTHHGGAFSAGQADGQRAELTRNRMKKLNGPS